MIDTIAVRPSRMSSPVRLASFSLSRPHCRPNLLISEVSEDRKPSSWVPPSWVLMVLAKVYTDSAKVWFHCIAISTAMWRSVSSDSNDRIVGCEACLVALRCST